MDSIIDKQKKATELMNFLFTIVNKSMELIDKKIHSQINALKFKISKDEREASKFIDNLQSSLTNFSALTGAMILMAEQKGHTYYYDKAIRKIALGQSKTLNKSLMGKLKALLLKYREILLSFYNNSVTCIAPLNYFAEIFDFGGDKGVSLKKVAHTIKKYSDIFKDRYVDLAVEESEQVLKHFETVGSAEYDSILSKITGITGAYDETDEKTYFSMNVYGGSINKWVSSSRTKHIISKHTAKIEMINNDIKSGAAKKNPDYFTKIIEPAIRDIVGSDSDVDIVTNVCKQANIYEPIQIQEKSLEKILVKFSEYIHDLPEKYMNEKERQVYMGELEPIDATSPLDKLEILLNNIQTVDTAIVVSRAARKFSDINSAHDKDIIKEQIKEVKLVSEKPESNTRYKLLSSISELLKKIKTDSENLYKCSSSITISADKSLNESGSLKLLKKYSKAELKASDEIYSKEVLAQNIAVDISEINKKLSDIMDSSNTDTCILHAATNVSCLLAHDVLKTVIGKRFLAESKNLLADIDTIKNIGGVKCPKIYNNRVSVSDLKSIAHKFTKYT